MLIRSQISSFIVVAVTAASLLKVVIASPASAVQTGNTDNATQLEPRGQDLGRPLTRTGTVKGFDRNRNTHFECYNDGACKPSPKLHGWAQYLRNRAFQSPSLYQLKSEAQQLIDCTDNSELCVWLGDRDASVTYRVQDIQRVIDVIYQACGGCGLAAFSDDPKMGALQMNRPCSCTGDTKDSVCSVGHGHKVLKTDC